MQILIPVHPDQSPAFREDAYMTCASHIPEVVHLRLAELENRLKASTALTLARDSEGILVGIIEGEGEPIESLYFDEDGKVARAGVNHPEYFPTIAALLEEKDPLLEREEALTQIQHLAYDGMLTAEAKLTSRTEADVIRILTRRLERINNIAESHYPDKQWIPIREDAAGDVIGGGDGELLAIEASMEATD